MTTRHLYCRCLDGKGYFTRLDMGLVVVTDALDTGSCFMWRRWEARTEAVPGLVGLGGSRDEAVESLLATIALYPHALRGRVAA